MGTLATRSRSTGNAIVGLLIVWTVCALTLPSPDVRSFTFDPIGARFGPITSLDAISSDRPTTSLSVPRSDHLDVIPAVASAEAGTRAALLWLMRDVRFPTSLMAMSPLTTGVGRRGPPLPSDG